MATATIALWLKHRMKHISSRGPYLSIRKAANSASLLSPYKFCSSLHLWNDVYSLPWSGSLFLYCFSSSVFLFLVFNVGNGSAFFGSVVVVCSPETNYWSLRTWNCHAVGMMNFILYFETWGCWSSWVHTRHNLKGHNLKSYCINHMRKYNVSQMQRSETKWILYTWNRK